MTTLMQAHRQWMSRAPDERFTSLLDMQDFKRRVRDNSRSHTISSRKVNILPVEDDPRALQILGGSFPAAAPTHWSFGQLCSLASPGNSPASYFRETNMPAPMIADCLNYNLRFTRGVEDIGVLVTSNEDGSVNELRSVNGPNYGRVYDADVVDALVERFGDPKGLPRVLGRSGVGCRKNAVAGKRGQRRTRDAAIGGNLDVSRCFLERCDPITFEERQECSLTDTGLVDCGLRLSKKYRCSHWCLLGGLLRCLDQEQAIKPPEAIFRSRRPATRRSA